MGSDLLSLVPEATLLLGGLATLVGGSFTPRRQQWRMRLLAAVTVAVAVVATLVSWPGQPSTVFEGTFTLDASTSVARIAVTGSLLILLLLAGGDLRDHPRESETCSLLLLGGAGALLMAGTTDLALLVVAFLLSSVPLYGLVGIIARPGSAEATLKTYLIGALFGILLMLGAVLLAGLAGQTGYAQLGPGLARAPFAAVAAGGLLVLSGLLFKAGGVPGHVWVPDATQGASVTAAAYLTTVPKVGAVVAVTRLVAELPGELRWASVLGVLAVASMTIGNLAAFAQDDVRRLLGWSTVSQVGYLLAVAAVVPLSGLARPVLLLFLVGYVVTNLAAFAVVAAEPWRRDLADWRGLGRRRPGLVAALVIALLGLVGTPPTAVFVGKLGTLAATWDAGLGWLAVAVALNTVASLFYYLRWMSPMLRPAQDEPAAAPSAGTGSGNAALAATLAAGLVVLLGLTAGPLWWLVS